MTHRDRDRPLRRSGPTPPSTARSDGDATGSPGEEERTVPRRGPGRPVPTVRGARVDDSTSTGPVAADPPGETAATTPRRGSGRRDLQDTAAASRGVGTTAGASGTSARAGLDRFRFRAELGRGGMGVVHLAHDPGLRREVAIKRLHDGDAGGDTFGQFIEEAQITGQLEHPNVVPVYELGTDADGRPWLAMKRVQGRTLQEMLQETARRRHRTFADDAGEWLDIFSKVCDAVGYAHSRGVIHRDLKPANIMVGEFGEVLLMDWGLARPLDANGIRDSGFVATDRRGSDADLTLQGEVFGTPAYMAPEQAAGRADEVGVATDVFALGGLLYEMLTLQPPYEGDVTTALGRARNRDLAAPRIRARQRSIPVELEAVTMRAMAARPRDRYASASELLDDVHAWRSHRPVSAHRDNPWRGLVKWTRRRPTTTLAAGLLLAAGLVVTVLLWQLSATERERALAEQVAAREEAEAAAARDRLQLTEAAAAIVRGELDTARSRLADYVEVDWKAEIERVVAEFREQSRNEAMASNESTSLSPERAAFSDRAFRELRAAREAVGETIEPMEWWAHGRLRVVCFDDHDGALDSFNRGLQLAPDDPLLLGYRAGTLFHMDRLDEARADFDRAVAVTTDNPARRAHLLSNRALLHLRQGRLGPARADLDEAIALRPEMAIAWCNRGAVRTQAGDVPGALEDYSKAVELAPRNAVYWFNRGEAQFQLGQMTEAEADMTRALRLRPDYIDARVRRGHVRRQAGDRFGAFADYERAIDEAPAHPLTIGALVGRGAMRVDSGDRDGARADLQVALQRDETRHDAWFNLAMLAMDEGNVPEALRLTDLAVRHNPREFEYWHLRSALHQRSGNLGEAEADINRALDLDNRNWKGWMRRGDVLAVSRPKDALEAYSVALRLCPDARYQQEIRKRMQTTSQRIPD